MIVTQIEELSRSRSKVYLDGSFAFVLYKGELRSYGLRVEEEISEEAYREITGEVLPKRAALRCMNLLKERAYTEKQLRDKLAMGQYPAECTELAIDYVKSYGYVDDRRYAEDYIENQREKKSRRVIEMDLYRKGVSRDVIEEAFAAAEVLDGGPDEEALARKLLHKKHFDLESADYAQIRKMSAYLYRKGIPSQVIRKVLSVEWEE